MTEFSQSSREENQKAAVNHFGMNSKTERVDVYVPVPHGLEHHKSRNPQRAIVSLSFFAHRNYIYIHLTYYLKLSPSLL